MSRRTATIVGIIIVVLIAVVAVTRWQRGLATKKLLADLPGDEYSKVMDSMTQLRQRGHAMAPALIANLQSDTPAARWRSAELLGEIGGRAAWAPLTTALADPSAPVREAAAMALGKLKALPAAPQIRALLADTKEDVGVRIASAQAIALLGDKAAAPDLQAILQDHPPVPPPAPEPGSPEAKAAEAKAAADKAAGKPAPPAPPPDTTIELRQAAAQAAGAIGSADLIIPLSAAADATLEPSAEVRTSAAYALGELASHITDTSGSQTLLGGLLRAADPKAEKIGDVRAAALLAVARVTVPEASSASLERDLNKALEDDFYWAREATKKTMKALNMPVTE